MKELLYINYPEITNISANIVNRRHSDSTTQIILDRTIFTPNSDYLYKEKGKINSFNLLDTFERNGKIVHIIDGKPDKSLVELSLNGSERYHNLYYNTAYNILKLVLQSFYNTKNSKLKLYDNSAQMIINDFFVDFNKDEVENFINHLIKLGIKIENKKDSTRIASLGQIESSGVCFNNTASIFGIHIYRYNIIGNGLIIEFITGEDFLNFNKENKNLIKYIEKIATSEDDSDKKIRKIISEIQNNKFK